MRRAKGGPGIFILRDAGNAHANDNLRKVRNSERQAFREGKFNFKHVAFYTAIRGHDRAIREVARSLK